METCLVDTSYLLARTFSTDPLYALALEWEQKTNAGYCFVTTDLIIIEFLDALSRTPTSTRKARVAIANALRDNSKMEVVQLTPDLFEAALKFYERAEDKDWGMTDCVSFAILRKRKIHGALTYDHHFEQAGFRALLRDSV